MGEHWCQDAAACPVIDPPKENRDEWVDADADKKAGALKRVDYIIGDIPQNQADPEQEIGRQRAVACLKTPLRESTSAIFLSDPSRV